MSKKKPQSEIISLEGGEILTHEDNGVIYDPAGWVSLKYGPGGSIPYDIELNRCNTDAKILSWVLHLNQKRWVTREMLRSFVIVCRRHHGLPWVQP